ncbi:hypothetical protein [Mesoterricola silvestris]|uniref:Uncharacterized protein n=1 Tax=Mesoterricola silvestris TaxID=2927979 RepID=A0AA48K9B1_9BACT|nr:hypothetical protein [Mesoterricola silvestris]BDU72920.1 hypothetical protein METEAL_20940 [Mesoterricola silvestris]
MAILNVQAQVKDVLDELDAGGKRQVPFALALALTRNAQRGQKVVIRTMSQVFDNPTPRTLQGTRVVPARKNALTAAVLIKDEGAKGTAPEKYLKAEVEGGQRNLKRSERALQFFGKLPAGMQWVVGSGAPIDQYGNLSGGYMTRLLSILQSHIDPTSNTTSKSARRNAKKERPIYFVGRPGGGRLPFGVYQRFQFMWGSAIKPILIFTRPTHYKQRLRFKELIQMTVTEDFHEDFRLALADALKTAKP